MLLPRGPHDPIQDVEEPITPQRHQIKRRNHRRDCRLPQQQQLWQDTHALQRLGEGVQHAHHAKFLEGDCEGRGDDDAADEGVYGELPRFFAFAGPRVDAEHEEDDVETGPDVEVFEDEIPVGEGGGNPEEVEVAG